MQQSLSNNISNDKKSSYWRDQQLRIDLSNVSQQEDWQYNNILKRQIYKIPPKQKNIKLSIQISSKKNKHHKDILDDEISQWRTSDNKIKQTHRYSLKNPQNNQSNNSINFLNDVKSQFIPFRSYKYRNSIQKKNNGYENQEVQGQNQQKSETGLNSYRYTFIKNHITNQAIIIKNTADAIDQYKQLQIIRKNNQNSRPKEIIITLPSRSNEKLPSIHNINNQPTDYYTSRKMYLRQLNKSKSRDKSLCLFDQQPCKIWGKIEQEAMRLKLMKRKQKLFMLNKK